MNKILLAAVLAASAVISGCTEKQDAHPSVKIVPTIKTRVSGLHFDNGDQIGLTILQGEQPYAENHPMTYEGSAFSGSGLLWYDDLNETSTLTAYHPYSSAGVPAEFTVAADQTGGCASSDLLGAVKRDVKPGSAPVGMVFYHLMSQLTIFLTNNSGATVTSVSVGGLVPTATVDLTVPTAAAKADAAVAGDQGFQGGVRHFLSRDLGSPAGGADRHGRNIRRQEPQQDRCVGAARQRQTVRYVGHVDQDRHVGFAERRHQRLGRGRFA